MTQNARTAKIRYTNYVIKICHNLLQHGGLRSLLIVFDSPHRLPLKDNESAERERKRSAALREARDLKRRGMHEEAYKKYGSAIKVTHEMAMNTARAVGKKFAKRCAVVECMFAPFEADAQLVCAVRDGLVDAVMTEDSDVLVYSVAANVPCPIVYKFKHDDGSCVILNTNWLCDGNGGDGEEGCSGSGGTTAALAELCRGSNHVFASQLRMLHTRECRERGSGRRLFVQACVLSGCDFVPHLSGFGTKKAFKLIYQNASRSSERRLHQICKSIRASTSSSSSSSISNDKDVTAVLNPKHMKEEHWNAYEENLYKAEAAFYYHHVRDARGKIEPLCSIPLSSNDMTATSTTMFQSQETPDVSRFQGDLSFVGATRSTSEATIVELSDEEKADTFAPTVSPPVALDANPLMKFSFRGNLLSNDNGEKLRSLRRVTMDTHDKENRSPHKQCARNIDDEDSDSMMIDSPTPVFKRECNKALCSTVRRPLYSSFISQDKTKSNASTCKSKRQASKLLAGFSKQQSLYKDSSYTKKTLRSSNKSKLVKKPWSSSLVNSSRRGTLKDFFQPLKTAK